MSVPTLLAVAGTVLMAIAIFVPIRTSLTAHPEADDEPAEVMAWPALVEPSAGDCDAAARLDLVDALASLRSPWAMEVLARAEGSETDPEVRAAIALALAGPPAAPVAIGSHGGA